MLLAASGAPGILPLGWGYMAQVSGSGVTRPFPVERPLLSCRPTLICAYPYPTYFGKDLISTWVLHGLTILCVCGNSDSNSYICRKCRFSEEFRIRVPA